MSYMECLFILDSPYVFPKQWNLCYLCQNRLSQRRHSSENSGILRRVTAVHCYPLSWRRLDHFWASPVVSQWHNERCSAESGKPAQAQRLMRWLLQHNTCRTISFVQLSVTVEVKLNWNLNNTIHFIMIDKNYSYGTQEHAQLLHILLRDFMFLFLIRASDSFVCSTMYCDVAHNSHWIVATKMRFLFLNTIFTTLNLQFCWLLLPLHFLIRSSLTQTIIHSVAPFWPTPHQFGIHQQIFHFWIKHIKPYQRIKPDDLLAIEKFLYRYILFPFLVACKYH